MRIGMLLREHLYMHIDRTYLHLYLLVVDVRNDSSDSLPVPNDTDQRLAK